MTKVFAFENKSDEIRFKSSSGGMFTTLADSVLGAGGIVFGAAFDEVWNVKHIGVTHAADLDSLRKSKYVFSSLGDTIAQAADALRQGRRVLFTGTPCQIAAVSKRLGSPDNLLTADVVCHSAPKAEHWERYLAELLSSLKRERHEIAHIDFRDKTPGWENYNFTIQFKDGKKYTQRGLENLYMRLFLYNLTVKDGCFHCPFKQPDSKADITIGDLWGLSELLPGRDATLGTGLVIVNTPKGQQALEDVAFIGELDMSDVARYNPALIRSASKPAAYDDFNVALKNGTPIMLLGKKYVTPKLTARLRSFAGKIKRKLLH